MNEKIKEILDKQKIMADKRTLKEPTQMLAKEIIFFSQPYLLICDGKCEKAWGINSRPKNMLLDDEDDENYDDDYEYLADDELGIAPEDPGTYEGDCGKPRCDEDKLNKWCCRESERSDMLDVKRRMTNLTKRFPNIPKD